jgi:hypothetical protein
MSKLEVDAIEPQSGTTLTIGANGDTVNIASGATITDFTSTGIDDNATSTAITINSSEQVGIGTASPSNTLEIAGSGTPININSTNDEVKKIQFENSGVIQGYYGCSSGTPMRILNGSSTELMRITSAGNVGIGTSSPATNLDINGNARVSTGSSYQFGGSDYKIEGSNVTNPRIGFITNSVERMRIDSSGNVGIGDTTPSVKLDVNGAIGVGTSSAPTWNTGTFLWTEAGVGANIESYNLKFNTGATRNERMIINYAGNVGIGETAPLGKVHIKQNDSGVTSAPTFADALFIEDSSNTGITICTPTNGVGTIAFGDSGDNDIGKFQYQHSDNSMLFVANAAERMRIDSSGKVGIGTSSPNQRLQLPENTNVGFVGGTNNAKIGGIIFGTDSSFSRHGMIESFRGADAAGIDLRFKTMQGDVEGVTERMRIDSSGNVKIAMQNFASAPSASNYGISFNNTNVGSYFFAVGTSTSNHIAFGNPNGIIGSIQTSGSSTAYNTSSDYRLKENVSYDFDATSRLKQLKPARFNFITDADKTVDGFLAHEVSTIVPEAISGEKDETEIKEKVVVNSNGKVIAQNIEQEDWEAGKIADENGNTQYPTDSTWEATKVVPVYQGIDQSKLVPLLVKTIQELEARITALENN